MTRHLAYAALVELVQGGATPAAAARRFGHLAFCEECTARARAVREIRADFDAAWEAAFVPAIAAHSGVRIELRALVDPVRRIARITAERLGRAAEDGTRLRLVPLPSGAGSEEPTRGVLRAELRVDSPALGQATVIADAARRSISVLLRPPEGVSSDRFLAELAPRLELRAGPPDQLRVEPFSAVEGANYLLAEAIELQHVSWSITIASNRPPADWPPPREGPVSA